MRLVVVSILVLGCVLLGMTSVQSGEPVAINHFGVIRAKAELRLVDDKVETIAPGAPVWILGVEKGRVYVALERSHFASADARNDDIALGWISAQFVIAPEEAIETFSQNVSERPDDVVAWLCRGNAHYVLRHSTEAIADYDHAVILAPENPEVWLRRGDALRLARRYDESIDDCSRAINVAPHQVSPYLSRARALGDIGRMDEAVEDCSKALTENPKSIGAALCRGFMRLMKGKLELSFEDVAYSFILIYEASPSRNGERRLSDPPLELFTIAPMGLLGILPESDPFPEVRLCDMLPGYRERLVLTGVMSERTSLFNDAIKRLDIAAKLRLPPQTEMRVLYHRAQAQIWVSRPEGASKDIARAIQLASQMPGSTSMTLSLETLNAERATCQGLIAKSKGEMDLALTRYDEAIRLNPMTENAYCFRGCTQLEKHEYEKALVDFEKVLETQSAGITCRSCALYGRSHINYARRDFEAAIADLTEGLRLSPGNMNALILRAQAWKAIGQFERSIGDCDEFIRRSPRLAIGYLNRAISRHKLNQDENAIEDYNTAVKLEPGSPDGIVSRGTFLMEIGEFAKAIADFEQATRFDPRCAQAYSQLAWIRATCANTEFRDGQSAVTNATKACEMTKWKDDSCISTLAAAYAESGQFDKAQQRLQEAIDLAPNKNTEFRKKMSSLFKDGRPYRTEPVVRQK